jgi:DNA polymerase-3 subunit epsilon
VLSYSLNILAEKLGLGDFNHHKAIEDAKMSVTLFEFLLNACGCTDIYQLSRKGILDFGWIDGTLGRYKPCRPGRKENINIDLSDYEIETRIKKEKDIVSFEHTLYGKIVVFTGVLDSMPRAAAFKAVENVGGTCGGGITKKTNYLVYGYQDKFFLNGKEKSSKLVKAESYISDGCDLQIIDEAEFLRLL